MRRPAMLLLASMFACLLPSGAFAGTVSGTVRNGTTGKIAAGVDVILIQLQGTMQPVANTKTDAEGRYHFDNPAVGTGPMLIRAVYKEVFYHEPIMPGKTTADVEVFEPTDKPSSVSVGTHAVILQPSGSDLIVGEEYSVDNKTQPPLTYYRADGSFLFTIPDGAQLTEVSAAGSSGMPVVQATIDQGKNREAIAYAFRPGQNEVRVAYKVPYAENRATLRLSSPYAIPRVAVLAPPTMQVSGEGFAPAGQEQGLNVYMRESVVGNAPFTIAVSGTAPPPPADNATLSGAPSGAAAGGADDSQNPSVNSRIDDSGAEAPVATATSLPARLDSLKWILTAGFGAIFVLGLAFLWLRPQPIADGATVALPIAPIAAAQAAPAVSLPATALPVVAISSAVAEADREVRGSLDDLKNTLFRLELRHQAGTITEEDYARDRQRIEQTLRELVRG